MYKKLADSKMATVVLKNVNKVFPGDVHAVKGFDLEIEDGELVVFVGPSGCGKTTTLRMIAGLESITEGTLEIGGKLMRDVQPEDRNVSMVFQNYALFPHMTVFSNIAFGLKMRKFRKAEREERVNQAAEKLGLSDLLKRKPGELSGGQRQRVALGRAIVRDPDVFLLDEPLSNLDAKMRVSLRRELAVLQKELGATMIYVTHDQGEAMTLGDRICLMNEGRIQQVGTPQEVYNQPANAFVAGFLGSPPMNLLKQEDGGVLGVRPERLQIGKAPNPNYQQWNGVVEMVENTGDSQIVHLRKEEHPIAIKITSGVFSVGQSLSCFAQPSDIYHFPKT
jgi:multiple sugar transport system ATP-binding protein